MRFLLIVMCSIYLCACDQPSPQQKEQYELAKPIDAVISDRVHVTKLSVLKDSTAYASERATYLIADTKTGREYIGVSGIGIVETGSHTCGKNCIREDER